MKNIITNSFCLFLMAFLCNQANASNNFTYQYANGITTSNIVAMQHSIMLNAIHNFENPKSTYNKQSTSYSKVIDPNLYGKMKLYGEYGDDGTVFAKGRNGGDTNDTSLTSLNNIWVSWQHFGDELNFKGFNKIDSRYDLVMLGLSSDEINLLSGKNKWGVYTGYVGGDQGIIPDETDITENGAYIGLLNDYRAKEFRFVGSINIGTLYNSAEINKDLTDDFSNMWLGAAFDTIYTIALDDTFFIQPNIYFGYTWIKSADYTSSTGAAIDNTNVSVFEITPGLKFVKKITNEWTGFAQVKHAILISGGGDIYENGVFINDLPQDNFTEYGIGIEKRVNRFDISANINRRDGSVRYGWGGGINVKYIF